MIRAVIFDVDGVLVNTDEFHYRAWRAIADGEGIAFDREINERLRGVSRMESLDIILERAPRRYSVDEKMALADRKNAAYVAMLASLSPADLLPGARPLLDALRRRGVRLAAGSSSRNARTILARIGLLDVFDAVVDGNDITHSKPHPEVFLTCAARLGVAPAQCMVVEDAAAGVAAARAAGMAVLGIGTRHNLPDATRIAPSLSDVNVETLTCVG